MRLTKLTAAISGVVLAAGVGWAQPAPKLPPVPQGVPGVRMLPTTEHDAERVGTSVRMALRMQIPANFHVQSNSPRDSTLIPTSVVFSPPAGVTIDEIIYPVAEDLPQGILSKPLAVFTGDFVIGVRATIAKDAPIGPVRMEGRLTYQVCDEQLCYAPRSSTLSWSFRIVDANGALTAKNADTFARWPNATAQASATPQIVTDVRAAIAANDIPRGEKVVADYRATRGVTPEMLLALSWLGRGSLAAGQLDRAEAFARETYTLALEELKKRPLDQEPRLPTAVGAAIEVTGNIIANRGAKSDAINYLNAQLRTYGDTSIAKRIEKNLNLLSLEGTVAPPLDLSEFQGVTPPTLEALKGKVVLLFFWAHWCPDCKEVGPVLEALLSRYGSRGLVLVAPTQRYGYVAAGATAPADVETKYIAKVRETYYPWLSQVPVTLSDKNAIRYGVSTTPTLVLVDRAGVVRLYKPGKMTEAELEPLIQRLL